MVETAQRGQRNCGAFHPEKQMLGVLSGLVSVQGETRPVRQEAKGNNTEQHNNDHE